MKEKKAKKSLNAINIAQGHFRGLSEKQVVIPEWENMTIHYKPMTYQEMSDAKNLGDEYGGSGGASNCALVIYKALDEDGKRIFKLVDMDTLMNKISFDVIERLALLMVEKPTYEETEKNS